MSKVSELFNSRSKKYDHIYSGFNPIKLLHQEKRVRAELVEGMVIDCLSLTQKGKIVDVGCGMGNILLNLREKGVVAKMYGLDISQEMIVLANKKLNLSRFQDINFAKGSIEDISIKANIVISLGVIGYQKKQEEFLTDLTTVVDKEGYLIFTTANGDSILRLTRRYLSEIHSVVKRKKKSKGVKFLSIKNKEVEKTLTKHGFKLEKKVYMTFGLGLFASSFECSVDRLLFKYFSNSFIGKYLSLSVIYVYKKVD